MKKMDFNGTANTLIKAAGHPRFVYGTAWKKAESARLVQEALTSGFTAVDTAAQPRHYQEALVGQGIRNFLSSSTTTTTTTAAARDRIYIQTKFTSPAGQDETNMPYDPSAPLEQQIHTSLASSFLHLRPTDDPESQSDTYLDCLVMHSPLRTTELTLQAWKILESYVPTRIRHLGISNVTLPVLEAIYNSSSSSSASSGGIKPTVVQNRFYADTAYDVPLRRFCAERGIQYQSFWTLTGNPRLARSMPVRAVAEKAEVGVPVALYALVMELGVTVLNGTTNQERMREDLDGVMKVKAWAEENAGVWEEQIAAFKALIGE